MKKLAYLFTIAAFAFTLGACTDDEPEYTPAPAVPQLPVYFSLENPTEFELFENSTELEVPIYRKSAEGELTVPVTVAITPDEDGFIIPTDVTFADGEKEATIVFPIDMTRIKGRVDYKVTVSVAEGVETPYYTDKVTYTLTYSPWDLVTGANGETMALFRDDLVAPLFGLDVVEFEVQMQSNPVNPNIVRLVDPYANWPYLEDGDYDYSTKHYMYFNITNPNMVFLCDKDGVALGTDKSDMFFHTGLVFYKDGEILITTEYNYCLYTDDKPTAADYGLLKQGNLTFGQKLMYVSFAKSTSLYYGNQNAEFRVIWPGYEPYVDPATVWNIIGEGQFTDGLYYPTAIMEDDDEELPTYGVQVAQFGGDPTQYRIMNPFKAGICPYGINYTGDKYIELDASNPDCVILDLQPTGISFRGLGAFYVMNYGAYLFSNGASYDDIIAAGKNDTFKDGVFNFAGGNTLYVFPSDTGDISLGVIGCDWQLVMPNVASQAKPMSIGKQAFNGNGPLQFKGDNRKIVGSWTNAGRVLPKEAKLSR